MLKLMVPLAVILAAVPAMGGTEAKLQTQSTPPAQAVPAKPAAPAETVATAPRISAAEARKALDAGQAVLVDVRSAAAYQAEHAKGAVSLPGSELPARLSELPKDKKIITYCT